MLSNYPTDLPGSPLVCAVSGGPDSMALLHALHAVMQELDITLHVAHLNHRIREEADQEAVFVMRWCHERNIHCDIKVVNVPQIAQKNKTNLEDTARQARYFFFKQVADSVHARYIALAHHMDDQVETILLHMARGSGLSGLCGMEKCAGRLWRPLLSIRKEVVLTYVHEHQIPYCIDTSNQSMQYARNRVRAALPTFEQIHEQFVPNVARMAQHLSQDEDALAQWAETEWTYRNHNGQLSLKDWANMPAAIQVRVLRRFLNENGLCVDLTHRHIEAIQKLCLGQTEKMNNLPHGYIVRRKYQKLLCYKTDERKTLVWEGEKALVINGKTETPLGSVWCQIDEKPRELGQQWPKIAEVNPELLKDAIVRTRRTGDTIHPLGSPGRKKLKDFLIDKKIPREERNMLLLAVDSNILWVPGYAIGQIMNASVCEKVARLWIANQELKGHAILK